MKRVGALTLLHTANSNQHMQHGLPASTLPQPLPTMGSAAAAPEPDDQDGPGSAMRCPNDALSHASMPCIAESLDVRWRMAQRHLGLVNSPQKQWDKSATLGPAQRRKGAGEAPETCKTQANTAWLLTAPTCSAGNLQAISQVQNHAPHARWAPQTSKPWKRQCLHQQHDLHHTSQHTASK